MNKFCFIAVIVMLLCGFPLFSQISSDELGQGLETLKISGIDNENKTVYYLPAVVKIVSPDGKEDSKPMRMEAGGQLIVQGMMSLIASPDDIKILAERTKKSLGDQAKIQLDTPQDFYVKIGKDSNILMERPKSGGSLTGTPFQATFPTGTSNPEVDLTIEYSVNHTVPQAKIDLQGNMTTMIATETTSSGTEKSIQSTEQTKVNVQVDQKTTQSNILKIEKKVKLDF
ncbi:MAG: hypothetical protein HQM08_17515 [Candidatus Riflebacteria bacterium]|nr:hypothetical protein [Candidatus Riflebacteria bacterium]